MNLVTPRHLLIMLLAGALTQSFMANAADNNASEELRKTNAVLTVNTTRPQRETWLQSQLANGSLWAWQDAVIAAETGGLRITHLDADVGSVVKRGQKLAQLSQELVKVEIAQKEALVAQAKAELAEAEANARRATEAKGGNAFSEQQITQYLIARDKARANLENAQAQLKNQQIRLQQTNIVAVDDGVVSSRSAVLGAVVQTGTELFRLVRQNRLEWRAELMAAQLGQIQAGQQVHLTLTSGEQIKGTVRVIAPTLDPNSRKAQVYVDLPATKTARPGMFAHGKIILGQKEAITVPESALVMRDGFAYVFEVDAQQRVVQRKVVTGRRADRRVEIVDGLNENAVIIASGGAFLNSGDTVRIAEANLNKTETEIQ